jgi:hypothetical protein
VENCEKPCGNSVELVRENLTNDKNYKWVKRGRKQEAEGKFLTSVVT